MMIVACIVCRAKTFGFQVAVTLAHDADPIAADGQQLPVADFVLYVAAAASLMAAAGLELVTVFTVNAFKCKIGRKGGGGHGWWWVMGAG